MSIIGHGVDFVETARIAEAIERHGEHFLSRVYTPDELAYCDRRPKRRLEHLAGRFAAKEAVLKVLGTGWAGGIAWTDVEVVKESSGRPVVRLHDRCLEQAGIMGIKRVLVSISHTDSHAMASAIGVDD